MCRSDDPKIYSFNGNYYYLPFEHTICSREEFSWFYSDIYEQKPLMGVQTIVERYKILESTDNMMVINMPPDTNGNLVKGDIQNLLKVAKELGISREYRK